MNTGRPNNRRKRIVKTIMNEKEERFYLAYFQDWATNRKITKIFNKDSPKKISTTVGDYCNKFLSKGWLNKKDTYFRYSFKTSDGNKSFKRQYIPAYKSNIKPFIDYFVCFSKDSKLIPFLSDKYALSLLHLFFELKESRWYVALLSEVTFGSPMDVYTAFLDVLEKKLIFFWLYFEGRFYPNLEKIILTEEFCINQIPDIVKIKLLIEKYLEDKRDDFDKAGLREEIIDFYNSSWEKFEKMPCFKLMIKINVLQNKGFSMELLKKEIKMKYFARLLYVEHSANAVINSFLGFVANSMVNMQPKRVPDQAQIKLLKYQLFSKHNLENK